MNLTATNHVTSSDAQILIMKMFISLFKSYFFPRGLRLCVYVNNVILDIFVAIFLLFSFKNVGSSMHIC
jgi:hypothetical protein